MLIKGKHKHESTIRSPTPPLSLLEQILFVPSPITEILYAGWCTSDFIVFTQVCRNWRRHLVSALIKDHIENIGNTPSQIDTNNFDCVTLREISDAPPPIFPSFLRRINIRTLSPRQKISSYSHTILGIYHHQKQEYQITQNISISPRQLTSIYGYEVARYITKINVDGSATSASNWEWIFLCFSLEELSIRWCSDLAIYEIATPLLDFKNWSASSERRCALREPIYLKRLKFWGNGDTRIVSSAKVADNNPKEAVRRAKKHCEILMTKYETDVSWCNNTKHWSRALGREKEYSSRWLCDKITTLKCGFCKKEFAGRCIECDLKNKCEECLEYVCDGCLVLLNLEDTDDDAPLQNPEKVNMLEYPCNGEKHCAERNYTHYFHPSCIPCPQKEFCPTCDAYFCLSNAKSSSCRSCAMQSSKQRASGQDDTKVIRRCSEVHGEFVRFWGSHSTR